MIPKSLENDYPEEQCVNVSLDTTVKNEPSIEHGDVLQYSAYIETNNSVKTTVRNIKFQVKEFAGMIIIILLIKFRL